MAATGTIYVQQVVWNGNTWTKADGGPLEFRYEITGQELADFSGDAEFPCTIAAVDKMARCFVRLRQVKHVENPGVNSSSLVATLKTKTGTVVLTFTTMLCMGVRGQQGRAQLGDAELVFVHQSADGTTFPML